MKKGPHPLRSAACYLPLMQFMLHFSIRSRCPENCLKPPTSGAALASKLCATLKFILHEVKFKIDGWPKLSDNSERKASRARSMQNQPSAKRTSTLSSRNAYLLRGSANVAHAIGSSRGGCINIPNPNATHIHDPIRPAQTRAELRQADPCHQTTGHHLGTTTRILLRYRLDDGSSSDSRFTDTLPRCERSFAGDPGGAGLGLAQSRQRGCRMVQATCRLIADQLGRSTSMWAFP